MNIYARNMFSKSWLWFVVFLTAMALAVSACAGEPASNEEAASSETGVAEVEEAETAVEAEESEEAAEPMNEGLPGEGIIVDGMYSGIVAELFQHLIVEKVLEELGYTIEERAEAQPRPSTWRLLTAMLISSPITGIRSMKPSTPRQAELM